MIIVRDVFKEDLEHLVLGLAVCVCDCFKGERRMRRNLTLLDVKMCPQFPATY